MDDRKIQTLHLTDSGYFFALCNDGTFWKHVNLYNIGTGSESNYWERLTDIPQGDEQYPLLMRCAKVIHRKGMAGFWYPTLNTIEN